MIEIGYKEVLEMINQECHELGVEDSGEESLFKYFPKVLYPLIFNHLSDADKIRFSLANKEIGEIYIENVNNGRIAFNDPAKIRKYYRSVHNKESHKEYFYEVEKLRSRCQYCPIYDANSNRCFDLGYRCNVVVGVCSFSTSFITAISSIFKCCALCSGCPGSTVSCWIASGASCGIGTLIGCVSLGLTLPVICKDESIAAEGKWKYYTLEEKKLFKEIDAALQPPVIRME